VSNDKVSTQYLDTKLNNGPSFSKKSIKRSSNSSYHNPLNSFTDYTMSDYNNYSSLVPVVPAKLTYFNDTQNFTRNEVTLTPFNETRPTS